MKQASLLIICMSEYLFLRQIIVMGCCVQWLMVFVRLFHKCFVVMGCCVQWWRYLLDYFTSVLLLWDVVYNDDSIC
jgi:hypothetical protein